MMEKETECSRDEKGRFVKGGLSWMKGKHHTKETKKKLSLVNKGKHSSSATEFKKGQKFLPNGKPMGAHLIGRKLSLEHKRKIGRASKGNTHGYKKGQLPWNAGLPKEMQPMYGKPSIMKGKHHTKETKERLRETTKKMWQNPEIRKKIFESKKGYKHSAETKKKISEAHKGEKNYWYGKKLSEEQKRKLILANTGRKVSEETRRKISLANQGRKLSEETKRKVRKARLRQVFPLKDNSIEIKLQNFLKELGIPFEKHKPLLNIAQADMFIEPNRVVFADGRYWHGCEDCADKNKMSSWIRARKVADILITEKLIRKGFVVLRFWEHKIKKMSLNDFKEHLKIDKQVEVPV